MPLNGCNPRSEIHPIAPPLDGDQEFGEGRAGGHCQNEERRDDHLHRCDSSVRGDHVQQPIVRSDRRVVSELRRRVKRSLRNAGTCNHREHVVTTSGQLQSQCRYDGCDECAS